jgi:CheY-like chemotaxis protein
MKRVLIIEDNAAIRENTAELLELNRFSVLTAENGQSGFELAKTSVPDIILCDMMMPDTDGRQFLKLVKEEDITANIPLVFFSAGSLSPEIQEKLVTGNNGYLKKPFTEEDLLNAVRKAGIISNLNSKAVS